MHRCSRCGKWSNSCHHNDHRMLCHTCLWHVNPKVKTTWRDVFEMLRDLTPEQLGEVATLESDDHWFGLRLIDSLENGDGEVYKVMVKA